jgi:hypothetical protein
MKVSDEEAQKTQSMPGGSENRDERKDVQRTSGATRRIVVQDLAGEKFPPARGRKLEAPSGEQKHEGARTVRHAGAISKTVRPSSKDRVNIKRLVMIAGGLVAILIVVPVVAIVLRAVRNTKPSQRSQSSAVTPAASQTPVAVEVVSPQQATTPHVEDATADGSLVEVEPAEVRSMVLQLASQISQKSGYEFGPEFIELIRGRTLEYSNERTLVGARQFRREINKSFRDEGLSPLVGYVLAMSRSKFDPVSAQKGVGIWQLPVGVARSQGYLGATENASKLKVPETSAQIAASYTRQLLSAFDSEDFMYAIACFGMSLQEAGQLQARLVTAAPDTKSRRDVMKVIKAGVLTGDQVDNIARFFAAGIVGENPKEFGLANSQPLSSLY